jgi:hypothetical protein
MTRVARVVYAGVPYHITQRGNNRQDVFLVDDNREATFGSSGVRPHGTAWRSSATA